MDTITLKVKTTKPTQEIELRFSETRSSKPIQFEIDWGDGNLVDKIINSAKTLIIEHFINTEL